MFREKLPLLGDNVVTVTDNKNRQSESNNVTEAPEAKETKNEAAPKAKLPWTQKIAYGFGEVGVFGAAAIEGFFFSTFLLEVAGLDPFWTGNVLMLGQIWDAVVHPIVGKLSDSTHSKWGRRRPWIFIASFPFALAYFAMWQKVPLISNQIGLFLYYLSAFILMNTSAACISVPYTALTPELATSYDLSTELTSLRMLCCIMYGICVSFVHSVLITAFPLPSDPTLPDYAKGYFLSALLISTVSLLPPSLLVICIRETRPVETTEERTEHESCCRRMIRLFSSIFGTLKEKAFVMAMCSYLLAWSTVNLVQSNLLLFMKYVLKMEDQFKWFILELQCIAAGSVLLWLWVTKRLGKTKTYYIGTSLLAAALFFVFFVNDNYPVYVIYLLGVPAGLGVGIVFLIPWSFLPDIISYDELKTGQCREGAFYSLFVLFQKAGLALALALSSYVLGLAGYQSPESESAQDQEQNYQPPAVILTLRLLVGPCSGALILLSFIFIWYYPLGRTKVEEIHEELRVRNQKQPTTETTS
jgi:GPH family glycoside/pentoside/hexuronide:cation symporter